MGISWSVSARPGKPERPSVWHKRLPVAMPLHLRNFSSGRAEQALRERTSGPEFCLWQISPRNLLKNVDSADK